MKIVCLRRGSKHLLVKVISTSCTPRPRVKGNDPILVIPASSRIPHLGLTMTATRQLPAIRALDEPANGLQSSTPVDNSTGELSGERSSLTPQIRSQLLPYTWSLFHASFSQGKFEHQSVIALTAEALELRQRGHNALTSCKFQRPTRFFHRLVRGFHRNKWHITLTCMHNDLGLLAARVGGIRDPPFLYLPDGTKIPNRTDEYKVNSVHPAVHYCRSLIAPHTVILEQDQEKVSDFFKFFRDQIEGEESLPSRIVAGFFLGLELLAPVPVQYVIAGLDVHDIWLTFAARIAIKSFIGKPGRRDYAWLPFERRDSARYEGYQAYAVSYTQESPNRSVHPRRVPASARNALQAVARAQPNAYVWMDKVGTSQKFELQSVWGATANLLYTVYPVLVLCPLQSEVSGITVFPVRNRSFGTLLSHSRRCLDCLHAAVTWFRFPPRDVNDLGHSDEEFSWLVKLRHLAMQLFLNAEWGLVSLDGYFRCWPIVERSLGIENCGLYMVGEHWKNLFGTYLLFRHLGAALRRIDNGNTSLWMDRPPCCAELYATLGEGWCAPDLRAMALLEDSLRSELACCTLIECTEDVKLSKEAFSSLYVLLDGSTHTPSTDSFSGIRTEGAVRSLASGFAGRAPTYAATEKYEALASLRGCVPLLNYKGVVGMLESTQRKAMRSLQNMRLHETSRSWGSNTGSMIPARLSARWLQVDRQRKEADGNRIVSFLTMISSISNGELRILKTKLDEEDTSFDRVLQNESSTFSFSGLGCLPIELSKRSFGLEERSNKDKCVAMCIAKTRAIASLRCVGCVDIEAFGKLHPSRVMEYQLPEDTPHEYIVLADVGSESVHKWICVFRVSQHADFQAEVAAGRPGFALGYPTATSWLEGVGTIKIHLGRTSDEDQGTTVNVVL